MKACIEAWFDGACEPKNPGGHGSFGVLIKQGETILAKKGVYLGQGQHITNNVAEYAGVIYVLLAIANLEGSEDVTIYGDSKLVIKQLSGEWGAYNGAYLHWYEYAKHYLRVLNHRKVTLVHIPREQNQTCDSLSKETLLSLGVRLRS